MLFSFLVILFFDFYKLYIDWYLFWSFYFYFFDTISFI